jgi:outer membrane immunogenic protein
MYRVLLATIGLAMLAASASAADLPRRYGPPVQQQPAFVAPMYNWTGFYLGINGGGAWGESSWSSTGSFDVSGALIGGTIGYNWQNGPWVLGLEGDIDWTNIKDNTTNGCASGCETANSWLATVRGRVGYAFDRFLPYVTGGLALGDIRARTPGFTGAEETNVGWTVGGGFEFAIAGNWSAKAEYLYVDLGDFNCGLRCGVLAANTVDFNTHIVRGGVTVRF